jgi:hypothetical protein
MAERWREPGLFLHPVGRERKQEEFYREGWVVCMPNGTAHFICPSHAGCVNVMVRAIRDGHNQTVQ